MDTWQLAAGSTIGRSHRVSGRNNQDAWYYQQSDDKFVAVVADGCSGGRFSEVGARLAVSTLTASLYVQLVSGEPIDWHAAERTLLSQIDVVARGCAEPYAVAIESYFLFTVVAVVSTPELTQVYACGDGLVVVNDDVYPLGPFLGNQPPYLAYQLIPDSVSIDADTVKLTKVWSGRTDVVDHLMIGSDGLDDLISQADALRPGLDQPVGPIAQFWQSDRYFRGNPELVSRELKLVGRDWPLRDPHPGLLSDDTTLIAIRRARHPEGDAHDAR